MFTSPTLQEDVWLTGPVNAVLYVSSNATDTDFTAKLSDVYADGTSRLIQVGSHGRCLLTAPHDTLCSTISVVIHGMQDGIVRMRWRSLPNPDPEPMIPGQMYQVQVSLWNTSYVFSKGHSIRLAVSSSNSPRYVCKRTSTVALLSSHS